MKRIIAAILFAAITLSVISCGGAKPADTSASLNEDTAKSTEATVETKAETPTQAVTEAPTENVTQAPVTEVPVTEAPVTEAPVTEAPTEPATEAPTEPVTEAPVTEAPTEPVTEAPVTEAPTEPATEAPTEPVTEAPQQIPENAYVYNDMIYIIPPDYYTMQEFAGLPSGLRNDYEPGLCFFNFSTSASTPLQGEDASRAFVESAQPGATILGYRSFKVDGVDVEQIDYEWATQPIVQSMVTVHLDGINVIVLFAALTTIDNALEEYTAIIDTLGILK